MAVLQLEDLQVGHQELLLEFLVLEVRGRGGPGLDRGRRGLEGCRGGKGGGKGGGPDGAKGGRVGPGEAEGTRWLLCGLLTLGGEGSRRQLVVEHLENLRDPCLALLEGGDLPAQGRQRGGVAATVAGPCGAPLLKTGPLRGDRVEESVALGGLPGELRQACPEVEIEAGGGTARSRLAVAL